MYLVCFFGICTICIFGAASLVLFYRGNSLIRLVFGVPYFLFAIFIVWVILHLWRTEKWVRWVHRFSVRS